MVQDIIFEFQLKYISPEVIDNSLHDLQAIMRTKKYSQTVIRKAYSITAECLENMLNYGVKNTNARFSFNYTIRQLEFSLHIQQRNYINNNEAAILKTKLDIVNSLTKEDMKPRFIDAINERIEKHENSGGGVGLYIIKRKSEQNLKFNIQEINKNISLFTMEIEIGTLHSKSYRREETKHTPLIQFDINKEEFIFSGHSRPEDADVFYAEVLEWLENNTDSLKAMKQPVLHFDFEYFNSSTLKNLIRFCKIFPQITPKNLKVEWIYDPEDENAIEDAKELSEIMQREFNFIQKKY